MNTKQSLRIGIVGAGANTRLRHIPGLQEIDGVRIVGVCNRSIESGQKVADEFGIAKVYGDWRELVSDEAIDAVVIGTWPYMHCQVTLAALAADKHVLCEARMACDAAEAHRMDAAAKAKPQLVTQIVPSPMTLRVDATIKRLLAEDYLGRILAIELRSGGQFLDAAAPMSWRQNAEYSGLNMMSLGIWYEAIMRWAGTADCVCAMGRTFVTERKDADGAVKPVLIPEHVDVTGQMACGAQLHMQISAVTGLASPGEVFLFGDKGTLRFSENRLLGAKNGDSALTEIDIQPQEEGTWRVEREFVDAIRGQGTIELTTFEDGVKYMEFTEAVARSMKTGTAVALPL